INTVGRCLEQCRRNQPALVAGIDAQIQTDDSPKRMRLPYNPAGIAGETHTVAGYGFFHQKIEGARKRRCPVLPTSMDGEPDVVRACFPMMTAQAGDESAARVEDLQSQAHFLATMMHWMPNAS